MAGRRRAKRRRTKRSGPSRRPAAATREGGARFWERRPRQTLWALLALALALRVAALLSLRESVYFEFLILDEDLYHEFATRLAEGAGRTSDVYLNLWALVYRLFGAESVYVRILNIACGTLTCLALYGIGRELSGRNVGLLACLAGAVYEPFVFYSIVPLKTIFATLFFGTAAYFFIATLNRRTWARILLAGMSLAILIETRANCIFLLPFTFLWLAVASWREASAKICAGVALVFALGYSLPGWTLDVVNSSRPESSAPGSPEAGLNFYLGNNLDNPYPFYLPAQFASPIPYMQGIHFSIEASRREGRRFTTRESTSYWIRQVIHSFVERPAAFTWRLLQKAIVSVHSFELGDHYHIGFTSQFVPFFRLPLPPLWLMLPLGFAGMALGIARGSRRAVPLAGFFLLYAVTLIIFFTNTRYRLPSLAALIPFAALGIHLVLPLARSRNLRAVGLYAGVALFFGVVGFLPIRGLGDMTAYLNIHAIVLHSTGHEEEALDYWQESADRGGVYSSFANLALAGQNLAEDPRASLEYLKKMPDDSPAAALKYAMIGDIFYLGRDGRRAVAAYRKSLSINYAQRKIREKIIQILERSDPQGARDMRRELAYVSGFYSGDDESEDRDSEKDPT